MTVPGSDAPNPSPKPEAAQTAPKTAVDATKYVGTPAVGTSKAAASAGLSSIRSIEYRNRPAPAAVGLGRGHGFSDGVVSGVLPIFSSPHSFRTQLPFSRSAIPRSSRSVSTPSSSRNTASGSIARPTALFVIYARCTHLGCTPDWKPSENKFKCPCHGSGYDSEGINFEGPAPRPMDRAHLELAPDGQIIVDTSRLYQWPKGQPSKFNDPGAFLTGV